MELKEFVEKALTQIVEGVAAAKEGNKAGGEIAPRSDPVIRSVQFDVAVTVEETSGQTAGISVLGGFFGIGGKVGSEEVARSVSRIKFSVPVDLP